jgi:tetratricopeptide (TPR) repeat protein
VLRSVPQHHGTALPDVEELGARAAAVMTAVAVLGPRAPLRETAELAGLSLPETLAAVDVLSCAGVLAAEIPLTVHTQDLAERILAGMPAGTRTLMRLRAAEMLRLHHGNAEPIARQLVEIGATGQNWAAHVCVDAAAIALDRGDRQAAADYLRHALSEPIAVRERGAVVFRLAGLLSDIEPLAALTHILQELRRPDSRLDGGTAGAVLSRIARQLRDCPAVAYRVDEATELLREVDQEAAVRVYLARAAITVFQPAAPSRLADLAHALAEADVAAPFARRGLLAVRACVAALRAPHEEGAVELATAVLAEADPDYEDDACWLAVCALLLANDDDAVERACLRIAGPVRPEVRRWFSIDLVLAYSRCRRGHLPEAVAIFESLLETCDEAGLRHDHQIVVLAAAGLAETLVHMGDPRGARWVLAERGLDVGEHPPGISMFVLRATGAVAAAHGDWNGALTDFLASGRLFTAWADVEADFAPWRFEVVLAALRAGRHEEACARARTDMVAAQSRGTRQSLGFAKYALALCEQGPRRAELLAEAVELLHSAGSTLAEVHARCDLGSALIELNRSAEARDVFTRADELARVCGAATPGTWFGETLVDRPKSDMD